jgi:ABC-2 type transport system permease protein
MSVATPAIRASTLRVELRKLAAFFRRDLLVAWSYRVAFFSDSIGLIVQVVIFSFVGRLISPSAIPEYGGEPTTYVDYVTIGIALSSFMAIALNRMYAVIRQEQIQGTLTSLVITPTAFSTIQLGSVAYDMAYVPVRTTLFFAFTTIFFNTHFDWSGLVPTLVILSCLIPCVWGLGILASAYTLTYKQGSAVVGLIATVLTVGSGAYFPLTVFPEWVQTLARFSPLAIALNGAREAMLGGAGWSAVWPATGILLGYSVVTLTSGMAAFRAALQHERRRGSLGHY